MGVTGAADEGCNNADDSGGYHQPKGDGYGFGWRIDGVAGMPERGARHHAQCQDADAADADEMYAKIKERAVEVGSTDGNQSQSCEQITCEQNPQHRFFQNGFIPPAVNLYGKNHARRKGKSR